MRLNRLKGAFYAAQNTFASIFCGFTCGVVFFLRWFCFLFSVLSNSRPFTWVCGLVFWWLCQRVPPRDLGALRKRKLGDCQLSF